MNSIGLNGALLMGSQALNAQQIAVQTIGNNISNANTPGYVRQRATLTTLETEGTGGELGNGVQVTGIQNLSSSLLDTLVQQSLSSQGYADNQANDTSTVQDALGEQFTAASSSSSSGTTISGSGPIQDAMTNFFGAMQSLAASPTSAAARTTVVQDAQTLASAIGDAYSRLQSTQSQVATDASTLTTQINQLSTSIASLNQQITAVQSASGQPPNDLIDNRQEDIEQLAGLVNITTSTNSNGSVNVALTDNPSVQLVVGDNGGGAGTSQSLSVNYDPTSATPLTVVASSTGNLGAGVPSEGSLGSDLDVANNVIGSPEADGNTGILGSLDTITNALISQVNTQNAAGYDLNGQQGGAIFTGSGAATIAVSSSVVSSPSLIAAGNGTGTLDGSNAQAMANLENSSTIIPAFQSMVSGVGQTVDTANTNQSTQDQITTSLQNQRNSISGVSIDEEMTNLISYQQAYDASARFITTISSLYSTLVNNTGTAN
jgi:flagellar hook-associated protein 1 FlgK